VVVSRRLAGRPWHVGGTDHTSHRLRRLGLSPVLTVAALTGGVALTAGGGVLVLRGVVPAASGLAAGCVAGVVVVVALLRVPVYEGEARARRVRLPAGRP
jgi:UDP-GlcNAc:undecaprenyl-phosphate GlcNAc-1-phosphate transferase